jgi:hypothetical protein
MPLDGTYGFVYSSRNGIGIGIFVISGEELRGADSAGGRYVGTACQNTDGTIGLDINIDEKPGMHLVKDGAKRATPPRRSVRQTLPSNFADGRPIVLTSPLPSGPLYVMATRVPDDWSRAVDDGISVHIGPAEGDR